MIPFNPESPASTGMAIDRMLSDLDASVELLGFGEALHGGAELLEFRNLLFQRLVATRGFRAIALESNVATTRIVNDFVTHWCADAIVEPDRD